MYSVSVSIGTTEGRKKKPTLTDKRSEQNVISKVICKSRTVGYSQPTQLNTYYTNAFLIFWNTCFSTAF